MIEISKETRKRLRELKAIAHAKEIEIHLFKISKKFDDWKSKKTDCWDLCDHIHQFHDGIQRDLFNFYNAKGINDMAAVARALALGILKKEDIPDEVADWAEAAAKNCFE
jgi:hypothetical protein